MELIECDKSNVNLNRIGQFPTGIHDNKIVCCYEWILCICMSLVFDMEMRENLLCGIIIALYSNKLVLFIEICRSILISTVFNLI